LVAALPKAERAHLLAWCRVKKEVEGFTQVSGLFMQAEMDVDLQDWWGWEDSVRQMKMKTAAKLAAKKNK
jgi:outer membrane protein W